MKDLDKLFAALAQSTFRNSFQLRDKDLAYLQQKGLSTVLDHAEAFYWQTLSARHH